VQAYNKQKGVALIIALVTSIIIALIISYFVWHSQQIIKAQFLMQNKISAELKADSVINNTFFNFIKYRSNLGSNANTKQHPDWNLYGTPFLVDPNTSLSIRAEASKISLIPTDYQLIELLLRGLSKNTGVNNIKIDQVVARLKDWQDTDHFVNLNGLEEDGYGRLGLIKPRNFNIQSIDELALIYGFELEWLNKIRDHVSLFTLADFNIRLSPKQLVEWLYGSDQAEVTAKKRGEANTLSHLKSIPLLSSQQNNENILVKTIQIKVVISLEQIKVVRKVVFSTKVALDSPYPYEIWRWES